MRLISLLVSSAGLAGAATIDLFKSPKHHADSQPPLIIWHGLGDKFDNDGLVSTAEFAQKVNPGTYVYIIRLSDDSSNDRQASFFGNLTEQLETVCIELASHPHLGSISSVNGLGFSQGGQFLRGYIERCNKPPVRNLVTFGSQHNGISKFQECGPTDWLCKGASALLSGGTLWSNFVQNRLVPAQYFRDPDALDEYLESSNFLADINNERKLKNEAYKTNLASLEKFVMFVFENDTSVFPKESGWFADVNSTSGEVTPLRNRTIYKENWLGLKDLDKKDALVFLTTPGRHMQLDDDVLKSTFREFFGPIKAAEATMDNVSSLTEDVESVLLSDDWLDL